MNRDSGLEASLAHAVLRVALGLNILVHGLGRLPKLATFASSTVTQFSATPLPAWSVRLYATSLPFAETMVGLLLLLGLWSRWVLIAGAIVIASLVFGTALREDWNTLAIQMLYALIYYVLLRDLQNDHWSLDQLSLCGASRILQGRRQLRRDPGQLVQFMRRRVRSPAGVRGAAERANLVATVSEASATNRSVSFSVSRKLRAHSPRSKSWSS
jgi:thiosulfate dehydrogenase [quinone] large subunit